MAFLDGFNANNVDPNAPMTPLPAGTYLVILTDSERKKNKAGTGEYLELKFAVQDGQHKGRKVVDRLNLWHPNETAQKIAAGDMSALCRAVGVMTPNDSTDLHNIPLEIIVGVTNPNEQGRVYNEVKGYQKQGIADAAPQATSAEDKPTWA